MPGGGRQLVVGAVEPRAQLSGQIVHLLLLAVAALLLVELVQRARQPA